MKKGISIVLVFALFLALFPAVAVVANAAHSVVMTADEFIDYLQYVVDRGDSRYDSGGQQSIGKYDGTYIYFDCWGLGESIICTKGKIVYNRDTTLNPWNLWDTTCGCGSRDGDWLEDQCQLSSDFSNMVPGEWLFVEDSSGRCYHVGYYIGNGKVIESTTDGSYNTQISTIDSNGHSNLRGSSWKWTFHGKVPWIEYVAESYINKCTSLSSYCSISSSTKTTIKTLPCSKSTSSDSEDIATISPGTLLTATKIYKNTAGNYWYRVSYNGKDGFVYSGDTTVSSFLTDDVTISGVTAPTLLKQGSSFVIGGLISSKNNILSTVAAYVYPGSAASGTASTGTSVNVSTYSYSLKGSTVDTGVVFNSLGTGSYTYCIFATAKSYYCTDGKTLQSKSTSKTLHTSRFSVESNSTPPPSPHTCDMNGGYAFVEAVHPHYKCYYCSVCGTAQRNYQEPTTRADCADCYPAQVSASSSSVSLDLCGTAFKTITFTCSGGLPSTYTLRFSYSKSNLSMAYGSWYGDSIDVTITGLQQCTEDVIVKLIDSTNNDAVLYEMTVWVYVNDLDHTWGSWHTTSNATCTESGSAERSCTRCGKTETKTLSAIGHNWSAWETRYDANCTDEGRLERYCSNCGSIEAYTTPALGHNYVDSLCIRCGAADPAGACDGGTACPGHDFADMPGASNWAHKGLDFCIARGLLSGTSDTTVSPNVTMNRAMLVTVLYSLEGKPEVTAENPFTDVENDRWFSKPVIWAAANGIVSGAGNGKFNPFGNVTREQIAVMLRSYARYKSFDTSASVELSNYPDAESTSGWAKDALSWAVAEGLISGAASGGATYLNPKNNATRAQVATILMQFVTKVAKD